MAQTVQTLVDQLAEYRETIRKTFPLAHSDFYPICANLFCSRGMAPSSDLLRASKGIINSQTGIFSNFRSYVRLPLTCLLATDDHPAQRM